MRLHIQVGKLGECHLHSLAPPFTNRRMHPLLDTTPGQLDQHLLIAKPRVGIRPHPERALHTPPVNR